MKVTIFGVGYVGLVQAAVLAEVGHDVVCVDIDKSKIDALNDGIIPIYEPGLENLVKEHRASSRLQFTTDVQAGVEHGRLQFIAVGTPPDEDGSADLQYVLAVADSIARFMNDEKVIVNKSTVPVGTADKVSERVSQVLADRNAEVSFHVASNPEFLKEGAAVNDCIKPDRIIVGTETESVKELFRELYSPFNRNHDRMIFMDVRSAELTKYAANCMLATKISFMNEMAMIAEKLGADIEQVRQGIGSDPRIGYHFIYPGCGYGGSCFPKDVQALQRTAEENEFEPVLLKAVEERNKRQKEVLFNKLREHYQGELKGKTFALWGLAFKPDTDDMRDAPSRVLMEALWEAGAKVQAYDPEAMEETQRIYGVRDDLQLCGTRQSALKGADALLICTEWKYFRAPDYQEMHQLLNSPVVFDGRNMYDPERMQSNGFTYIAMGR